MGASWVKGGGCFKKGGSGWLELPYELGYINLGLKPQILEHLI